MANRILLIEDSEAVAKSIILNLNSNGYRVITADSVKFAHQILTESDVDLMIADNNFRSGEIMDFLEGIYRDEILSSIPVLMLTDEKGMNSENRDIMHGARDWIIKPFSADRLIKAVRKLTLH